MLEVAARC